MICHKPSGTAWLSPTVSAHSASARNNSVIKALWIFQRPIWPLPEAPFKFRSVVFIMGQFPHSALWVDSHKREESGKGVGKWRKKKEMGGGDGWLRLLWWRWKKKKSPICSMAADSRHSHAQTRNYSLGDFHCPTLWRGIKCSSELLQNCKREHQKRSITKFNLLFLSIFFNQFFHQHYSLNLGTRLHHRNKKETWTVG